MECEGKWHVPLLGRSFENQHYDWPCFLLPVSTIMHAQRWSLPQTKCWGECGTEQSPYLSCNGHITRARKSTCSVFSCWDLEIVSAAGYEILGCNTSSSVHRGWCLSTMFLWGLCRLNMHLNFQLINIISLLLSSCMASTSSSCFLNLKKKCKKELLDFSIEEIVSKVLGIDSVILNLILPTTFFSLDHLASAERWRSPCFNSFSFNSCHRHLLFPASPLSVLLLLTSPERLYSGSRTCSLSLLSLVSCLLSPPGNQL